MPTSKETRVRVEDFEKSIAQICPANGLLECRPRSFLSLTVSARIFSISARVNFSMLSRCFIAQSVCRNSPGFKRNNPQS